MRFHLDVKNKLTGRLADEWKEIGQGEINILAGESVGGEIGAAIETVKDLLEASSIDIFDLDIRVRFST